jgi:hypothetical protein
MSTLESSQTCKRQPSEHLTTLPDVGREAASFKLAALLLFQGVTVLGRNELTV